MVEESLLIKQLKQGSQTAFDQIYKMYAGALMGFCMQWTKRREDAEEIVQDVFVRLWRGRENIQHETTLRPLLFIMSKNLVINAYRSTVNSPVYEDYNDYRNSLRDSNDTTAPLEYEEYLREINNAISRLPITQQKVVKLSRFSQLSNKEIATELNLSEQTIKNQLSLGIKTLRTILSKTSLSIAIMLNFV